MKDKKQIALWAIKEELDALKRIKEHYQRKQGKFSGGGM